MNDLRAPLTAAALILLTGCSIAEPTVATGTRTVNSASPTSQPAAAVSVTSSISVGSTTPLAPDGTSSGPPDAGQSVVGTVVRFSARDVQVDVTIDQNTPAVRDFLSTLPLTLDLQEFGGTEKIAYLPQPLNHEDTPGSDPENGDLIYYAPWSNLGFYYNADGVGYSEQTLHIGTYQASREQLDQLEGAGVAITIVP